jgi:hypothetical protein
MPEPTDLRTICSALEHFSLPAALCSIERNRLLAWNRTFQAMSGLRDDELAQTPLSSLILLDQSYGGLVLEDHDPEHVVQFVPCVLKKALRNDWVAGRALKRSDGLLLAMLNLPVGDVAFEGFIHGHLIGREEERQRTRQLLHDILGTKLLVASFLAHDIGQTLAAAGAEEGKELAKISQLLYETIDDIALRFGEPVKQTYSMPKGETESLNRLLGLIDG